MPNELKTIPKWFKWFLRGVAVINALLIINIISLLIVSEPGVDLMTSEVNTLIFQAVLHAIELGIYVLFLFRINRKLVIGYFVFLIINALFSVFTGGIFMIFIRYIPIYFAFQSQWGKFKK